MYGGGATDTYTFTITNDGTNNDDIYKLTINIPSGSAFSIDTDTISCPAGWTKDANSDSSKAICITDPFGDNVLKSGNSVSVSFSATSPSILDAQYTWEVVSRDTNNGYENTNQDAKTTVDVTAPTTTDNAPSGWQKSDVTVTLTPSDGNSGSGVAHTYYCVYNQGETACGPTTEGTSVSVSCNSDSVCQKFVRYYSVDKVGQAEDTRDSVVIQIDKAAPTTLVSVGTPKYQTDPTYITPSTKITLNAVDEGSGVNTIYYKIDDGDTQTYSDSNPITIAGGGLHTVSYWSKDTVGNIETQKSLQVYVDNSEPTVGQITIDPLYSDGSTNYISGTSVISATVNDDGSGIASCEYTLNADVQNPTWNTTTYENGVCKAENVDTSQASSINIRATDNLGNKGEGTSVDVIPDTQGPTISGISITPTSPTNDNTPEITFVISDSKSGVKTDSVQISDATNVYTPSCLGGSCSYTFSALGDGTYSFVISASDNVGNSASDDSLSSYVIDTKKPTTSDNAPSGWQNSDVIITLTPSDPDPSSGIEWTKYCTDTANNCDPSSGTDYTGSSVTISDEGTTYFRYASKDKAGNVQDIVSREIKIDKSEPTTSTIISPSANSYLKGTVTIDANAEDNSGGSGIAKVEFYYGNTKIGEDMDSPYSINWDTTKVIDGTYSLTAVAVDNAGNSLTSTGVSVTVDNTAPTVSITSPTNTNPVYKQKGQTVSISYTYTEQNPDSIVIKIKNETAVIGTTTINTELTGGTDVSRTDDVTLNDNAADGNYDVEITVNDKAGNTKTETETDAVVVDTTPPTLDSIAPSDESALSGTQTFTFDFNDVNLDYLELDIYRPDDTPNTRVQVTLPADNSLLQTQLAEFQTQCNNAGYGDCGVKSASYDATEQKWTVELNTTNSFWQEGTTKFYVEVGDSAGNQWGDMNNNPEWGGLKLYTYIFDNTPPKTTLSANPETPDGNNGWYSTTPTITLTCDDSNGDITVSGCDKIYYKWDAESSYTEYDSDSGITAQEGTHTLHYYSTDNAGNSETEQTQDFKVDTGLPTVSTPSVTPNTTNYIAGTVSISAIAEDNGAGISKVEFYYANATDTVKIGESTTGATYSVTWDTTKVADGTYSIKAVAIDKAGNSKTSVLDSITVDNTGPNVGTITITPSYTDANGNTYVPATSSIEASIIDDGIGVKGCEYTINADVQNPTWNTTTYENGVCKAENVDTSQASSINIRATDNLGNKGEGTSVNVIPDTQAPISSNFAPANNGFTNEETPTISVDITDIPSGVDKTTITMTVGGSLIDYNDLTITEIANGYHVEYTPTTSFNDGDNVGVSVSAEDNSGNMMSETWAFTVDLTPPSILSRTPGINAVGVDPSSSIIVRFSEPVNINEHNVVLSYGSNIIATTVTYNEASDEATITPATVLDSNKGYTITLSGVTDRAGNLLPTTTWSFTTATYYEISLTKGWNLVSLPIVPTSKNVEDVLGDEKSNIDKVWTYDSVEGEWHLYDPNDAAASDLTTMDAGHGYWISYTKDTPGKLSGWGSLFLEGNNAPPERTLTAGWNLIGYYQRENTNAIPSKCALFTLTSDINDETAKWWSMIVGYDNQNKQFNQIGYTDNMNPGQGYWIFMKSSSFAPYKYGPGLSAAECDV